MNRKEGKRRGIKEEEESEGMTKERMEGDVKGISEGEKENEK